MMTGRAVDRVGDISEGAARAVFDLSRYVEAHTKSTDRSREQAIGGVTAGMISLGEEVT